MSNSTQEGLMIGEITPVLFVGLGGAGGKVVGRIARKLKGKWDYQERYAQLSRFAVLDTDSSATKTMREGREGYGPVDRAFLISDFDKKQYAEFCRGGSRTMTDPYFTQWVYDDYVFRGSGNAGAGQIRLESRLGLYHAQHTTDIHNEFLGLLNELRDQVNVGRNVQGAIQIHVAFSVMGGTGSGTFLPFAYFIRNLARGVAPVKLFAYAIQPHVYQEVTGANFEDVCANAYASLKELEYFNRCELQGDEVEFHYDTEQRISSRGAVKGRPFDLTYIIDVPAAFSSESVIDATADNIYMQVYSPLGKSQASDVDNYVKHTRQLYPEDLAEETGRGYTAHYGSFGMCVLHVPGEDLLRYSALRFASDAIDAYLLMRDPEIVPPARREEFNRFQVSEESLRSLSQAGRNQKLDEVFARKVELMASEFKDRPETFWGRLLVVSEGLADRFRKAFDEEVNRIVERAGTGLTQLSPQGITEPTWTADHAIQQLRRSVHEAKDGVDANIDPVLQTIGYDWWPKFLATAGPASSPQLNAYEQRYALLVLRGLCPAVLARSEAPLSAEAVDDAVSAEAGAANAWSESAFQQLERAMAAACEELRATAPKSFLGFKYQSDKQEEAFDETRRSAALTFNRATDNIRRALGAGVRGRLLRALFQGSESLLATFREIDKRGPEEARAFTQLAESFRLSGRMSETLPDGTRELYEGEANQFSIDEEALLGPTGTRLWDWYYLDQVRPVLSSNEQLVALQESLTEALKPKFDAQGRRVERKGDRVVKEIAVAIRSRARAVLQDKISGEHGIGGLMLDDGIALEALYMKVMDSPLKAAGPLALLAPFRPDGRGVDPSSLWEHPEVGIYIKTYVEQKIARAARHKASELTDLNREIVGPVKYADRTPVGANARYLGEGPFSQLLRTGSGAADDDFVPGWYDQKRIFFYHYLVGVPLYAFPRVLGELQFAYGKFQAKSKKHWYLHVDRNFENLPDLDPADIKEELLLRLPLLLAKEKLLLHLETGMIHYDDSAGTRRKLGSTLIDASEKLVSWKNGDSECYRINFAKDIQLIVDALKIGTLDDDSRAALTAFQENLRKRLLKLEEAEATPRAIREVHRKLVQLCEQLLRLRAPMKLSGL